MLVGERGPNEDDVRFCALVRACPPDVLTRLAAEDGFAIDGVVRAMTGEVLKGYEVLCVTLYNPAGEAVGNYRITGDQQIPR